jgi:hypothetical protein
LQGLRHGSDSGLKQPHPKNGKGSAGSQSSAQTAHGLRRFTLKRAFFKKHWQDAQPEISTSRQLVKIIRLFAIFRLTVLRRELTKSG